MTRRRQQLAFSIIYAWCGSTAICWAQEPAAPSQLQPPANAPVNIPAESYKPQVFNVPDGADEYIANWRKPSDVAYVLISGCGAGGDGASSTPNGIFVAGGQGGRAANYTTVLVGPLTADRYQVSVKRGGAAASVIVGDDLNLVFAGGNGIEAALAAVFDGSDGAGSIFGAGGAGGKAGKPGGQTMVACAGGGGGGGQVAKPGGRGGAGRVVIFPVPDLERLFDVMGKLGVPSAPAMHSTSAAGAASPSQAAGGPDTQGGQ